MTRRYWLSFYFKAEDYRPLTYPPREGILGYWSSGIRCADDATTLCILVEAESEAHAKEIIAPDWPESKTADCEWRFIEERDRNWLPNDRFPLADWSVKRLQPTVNEIMDYESGEMNEEDTIYFFQKLIDSGMCWQLQGHYGRTARAMMQGGYCVERVVKAK